jgi:hypothetical protein
LVDVRWADIVVARAGETRLVVDRDKRRTLFEVEALRVCDEPCAFGHTTPHPVPVWS